ncbi:MAG: hypothetical protein K6G27_14815 [Lachnospiraceae bacterium]|nr:hypothetical protein [Lachnospiraceae bacterium]
MINNKKIGKLAVTGIITMLTAIWGIVSLEMAKDMKKEIEGSKDWEGTKQVPSDTDEAFREDTVM